MINFCGMTIEPEEIVDFLKREMLAKEVCQKIVSQKVIEKAAKDRNIKVTPEEIQTEADKIRYTNRLEKTSDTLAWLADQMLTPDEWEIGIRNSLLTKKLATQIFDKKVEQYFASNRLDFDQFILYQIVVPYEQLAQEIFYQIEEEEISFYEAAHLYDLNEQCRYLCGYKGKVHRWSFPPDIAAQIFKTPVSIGEVIGPLKIDKEYHLFMIEKFIQAQLTPEKRQEIIDKLFQEWLHSELNYFLHNEQPIAKKLEEESV